MSNQKISDEFISAFVDDQLTSEEKAEAYQAIHNDSEANTRVCDLRKIRDLLQLAYKTPPVLPVCSTRPKQKSLFSGNIAAGIAAGVALVLGVSLGFQLNSDSSHVASAPVDTGVRTAAYTSDDNTSTMVATSGQVNILIQLNSGDRAHIEESLNEVESVLNYYREIGQSARVEVITNGDGLTLLRKDISPFAERVKSMQREYDNLTFVACQNTINRLNAEQGITVQLIPGTVVIDSAVAQIMRRQQQGWAYIQV
ncbi:MAG: hypothetical protein BMS9Abin36_1625 [Gammaproteobacteria bacterium]|nr:MAG: hypothetical protein BMS9Abin36_1625 [Gammaproteobacteria bacterium]